MLLSVPDTFYLAVERHLLVCPINTLRGSISCHCEQWFDLLCVSREIMVVVILLLALLLTLSDTTFYQETNAMGCQQLSSITPASPASYNDMLYDEIAEKT